MQLSLGPAKLDDSVDGHSLEFHALEPYPGGWNPGFEVDD